MAASRQRTKNRSPGGSFVAVPKQILESSEYALLSSHEVKLLMDMLAQYNGKNNGDLTAAWSVMKNCGWRSKGTLNRAVRGLLQSSFIMKTRQGGKHKASLYAVTFRAIDECKGKIEVKATVTALNSWKMKNRFATPDKGQCAPYEGQL